MISKKLSLNKVCIILATTILLLSVVMLSVLYIITRRKELAMLQSIGMTGKQLKKMLSFEGLYYAAGTVVASIVFGSLVSVIIVRAISNSIWFFTYKFVIFPMFVIYPFLIALTVIIPAIIYRKIAKTSIIERLHQN